VQLDTKFKRREAAMTEILTVGDAARLLEVSPGTIRVWVKKGKLQALRTPGGVRIFYRQDVERLRQDDDEVA
jgi:excisionase family DNA binding protein